jgi:hypothetical protein
VRFRKSDVFNLSLLYHQSGLFSAILTAFLAASTNMLQQDPAETTVLLLLTIAQAQARLEQGMPLASRPPVDIPSFSPELSARWINALWFMALTLSLAAAMVAMLAKEWLGAFMASHMRPPHAYALARQARLDSLHSWHALQIIDFLPTLLHISLVLFGLGLVINLWILDHAIAITIAAVGGLMVFLYMGIVVLGAFKELCPFNTRISKYLRAMYDSYKGNLDSLSAQSDESTTSKDLLALKWLADNARDPNIGDCAYQALAGLRLRQMRPLHEDGAENASSTTCQDALGDEQAVMTMFARVQIRLSKLLVDSTRQLAVCRGENAARYAGALAALYPCLKRYLRRTLNTQDQRTRDSYIRAISVQFGPDVSHFIFGGPTQAYYRRQIYFQVTSHTRKSLNALDEVWNESTPPFSPEAYANLTAAELRLVEAVADELVTAQPSSSNYEGSENLQSLQNEDNMQHKGACKGVSDATATQNATNDSSGPRPLETAIDVRASDHAPPEVLSEALASYPNLRARYSRSLFRASIQLYYHVAELAPIGNYPLVNLLEAIHCAARNVTLNPADCLGSHHPQEQGGRPPIFHIRVVGTSVSRYLGPLDIGAADSLVGCLVTLLGSASTQAVPRAEMAAAAAMVAVCPRLIKQWTVQKSRLEDLSDACEDPSDARDLENWHLTPIHWDQSFGNKNDSLCVPDLDNIPADPLELAKYVLNQLLLTLSFAVSQIKPQELCELVELAITSLYSRGNISPISRQAAYRIAVDRHGDLLERLIDSLHRTDGAQEHWSQKARRHLLHFLAIVVPGLKFTIFRALVYDTQSARAGELRIWSTMKALGSIGGLKDTATLLLGEIPRMVGSGDTVVYPCFTRTSYGFPRLIEIGVDQSEYAPIVVSTIVELVVAISAATDFEMAADAVPGFLRAVNAVCTKPPSNWNKSSVGFLQAVVVILQTFGQSTPQLFVQPGTLAFLKEALGRVGDEETQKRLLSDLKEIEKIYQYHVETVKELGYVDLRSYDKN